MAQIEELQVGEDAQAWARLGFEVSGGLCALGAVSVRLQGGGGGIRGWRVSGLLDAAGLDGLPTEAVPQSGREAAPEHPNGVLAIDHVVVMTPDLDRTVAALQEAGLDLRRIREEPTPAGAPRQAFFRLGAEILEVVQEPAEVLAAREGDAGPARFWGLALLVGDMERAAAAFGEHLGEARAAVQPGRRIATVRRSAGLGVPMALLTAHEAARA